MYIYIYIYIYVRKVVDRKVLGGAVRFQRCVRCCLCATGKQRGGKCSICKSRKVGTKKIELSGLAQYSSPFPRAFRLAGRDTRHYARVIVLVCLSVRQTDRQTDKYEYILVFVCPRHATRDTISVFVCLSVCLHLILSCARVLCVCKSALTPTPTPPLLSLPPPSSHSLLSVCCLSVGPV